MALAIAPTALSAPVRTYDVMLRVPGLTGWQHGTTTHTAAFAMECQNYVRRNYAGLSVKILGH